MKKFMLLFLALGLLSLNAGKVDTDCTFKGKVLKGRVRIVSLNEDFKVRPVSISEDIRVQMVPTFANSCGQWEIVTINEDFTIRIVDIAEDFTLRFVGSFPGVN